MIPLKDYNSTRSFPFVTYAVMAVCIGIYFFVQPNGQSHLAGGSPQDQQIADLRFTLETAAIPCEVVKGRPLTVDELNRTFGQNNSSACSSKPQGPSGFPGKSVYLAVLYSMFLHGGLLHLGGNMLYLFVFGNNIEDRLGHVKYAVFYLVAGLVATASHIALDLSSTIPMIGASGAIAGVMGAYAVVFPKIRVRTAIFFVFILIRDIPAAALLGFWFISQFFVGSTSGVAWGAHVGGFVFGALAGLLWRSLGSFPRRSVSAY